MHYHVIVNPNAGVVRHGLFDRDALTRIVADESRVTYTRDLEHLDEVVQKLKEDDVRTIAVLGGDGTILRICNSFADDESPLPQLFLLGGGTTNALMVELDIAAEPLERLARLKEVIDGAEPTALQRNTLSVNGNLGFIFGPGYITNVTEYYNSHKSVGTRTAAWVTAKVVAGMIFRRRSIVKFIDRVPATLHCDGTALRFDAFNMGYVATLSRNGLNLKVTPEAGESPDRFGVVIGDVTVGEFLSTFTRMTFGAVMDGPGYERRMARELRIECREPIPWSMDGERFEPAKSITVKLGPRLRVLA